MEALMAQFTFLSDEPFQDKNFDPSTVEDLTKLFEIEAYKSWADMEHEQQKEVEKAETSMQEAKEYLESAMQSCMDEFEEEFKQMGMADHDSLVGRAERAKNIMEKAATIASNKYIQAADKCATASLKSAIKGNKVHPS